jgi:hypothetical protein
MGKHYHEDTKEEVKTTADFADCSDEKGKRRLQLILIREIRVIRGRTSFVPSC